MYSTRIFSFFFLLIFNSLSFLHSNRLLILVYVQCIILHIKVLSARLLIYIHLRTTYQLPFCTLLICTVIIWAQFQLVHTSSKLYVRYLEQILYKASKCLWNSSKNFFIVDSLFLKLFDGKHLFFFPSMSRSFIFVRSYLLGLRLPLQWSSCFARLSASFFITSTFVLYLYLYCSLVPRNTMHHSVINTM